ncbi:MAG: type I-G CRISPR-associated helicase/endonuclease Cas3g [Nitriliruptorales bacterium]
MEFERFFQKATGGFAPYEWQREAADDGPHDVLAIPTGMGKTEGAVLAWAWRKLVVRERSEPRHLVYCLPMRVLVRQTAERLRACFERLRESPWNLDVPVFMLMGGDIDDAWAGLPDRPWVLVGTQDQLLSRALNRGYAMSRYRWPVHFGLLNNDCRWIVDEVQLMGPGLWTTAQLDWMRRDRFGTYGPCPTTWMSATVGTGFVATTDRKDARLDQNLRVLEMRDDHAGGDDEFERRRDAQRPLQLQKSLKVADLASRVLDEHVSGTLSLVVCNTVTVAREVFEALPKNGPPARLVTSRFRATDRAAAEKELLEFEERRRLIGGAMVPDDPGLVCVSTQVVEAGVDVSAHRLWCEVAPWPSVVQRLGRLNRDGRDKDARATFWYPAAPGKANDRIGPYKRKDLDTARQLIEALVPLSHKLPAMQALEELAQGESGKKISEALAPRPASMPRAFDVHGLFSTDPDLHGGFTDVSDFVRDADPDPDVTVIWRDRVTDKELRRLEGPSIEPLGEGCPVRASDLKGFLKKAKQRARMWDDDAGRWQIIDRREIRPGMVLMLPATAGGYDPVRGWTGEPKDQIDGLPPPGPGRAFADEPRSELEYWCGLSDHLSDAAREAEALVQALGLDQHDQGLRRAAVEAARFHDLGKAHPRWQKAIPALSWLTDDARQRLGEEISDDVFAKTPRVLRAEGTPPAIQAIDTALRDHIQVGAQVLGDRDGGREAAWLLQRRLTGEKLDVLRGLPGVAKVVRAPLRSGLRHEAATALAMWERYRSGQSGYPALAVYLAAAHHGKVRTTMRSRSAAGGDACGVPSDVPAIEVAGDTWALDFDIATDGAAGEWTDEGFILTDHGWTGLVADLLGPWRDDGREPWDTGVVPDGEPKALGPFRLAYLEALVRVADWRASERPSRRVYVAGEGRA